MKGLPFIANRLGVEMAVLCSGEKVFKLDMVAEMLDNTRADLAAHEAHVRQAVCQDQLLILFLNLLLHFDLLLVCQLRCPLLLCLLSDFLPWILATGIIGPRVYRKIFK